MIINPPDAWLETDDVYVCKAGSETARQNLFAGGCEKSEIAAMLRFQGDLCFGDGAQIMLGMIPLFVGYRSVENADILQASPSRQLGHATHTSAQASSTGL